MSFLNDYRISLSKLKAKSFYMFHKCSYTCYSGPQEKIKPCLKECRFELDEFYRLKNKSFPDIAEVFLGPSSVDESVRGEYIKDCYKTEGELKKYVKNLDDILNKLI